MIEVIQREGQCELKDLVGKFIPESISKEIEKVCSSIYPLHDVFIRKVKLMKKPKVDGMFLFSIFIFDFYLSQCNPCRANAGLLTLEYT